MNKAMKSLLLINVSIFLFLLNGFFNLPITVDARARGGLWKSFFPLPTERS